MYVCLHVKVCVSVRLHVRMHMRVYIYVHVKCVYLFACVIQPYPESACTKYVPEMWIDGEAFRAS